MTTTTSTRSIIATAALFVLAANGHAENWPKFRGPRGDGSSLETNAPLHWSALSNVLWKTTIAGEGHASPIVWGQSAFVTSAIKDNGQRILLRIDVDSGKVLWQRAVLTGGNDSMHRENSSASSTPATDGTCVFTSFQSGDRVDIRCFDFTGRQIWAVQPLSFDGQHGYSYSPILYGNLVLFDCRQEGEAALLALDKRTGQLRWSTRPAQRRISHVTPLLIQYGAQHQLVVCGSDEIRSYDPATGQPFWWCRGPSDVAVAGLSYGDGLVFATAGYPTRTRMAVRVSGRGDVTQSHVAWSFRQQVSYVPSPIYHEGHLYTMLDDGMLFCFDAKTGQPVWDHRVGGHFRSSPVLANGHIYATNDRGMTTVFRADPKAFRRVASNDLKEFCYATPAVSNGRVFVRTGSHLYCIGTAR